MQVASTQLVAPVHALPPHWPYLVCPATTAAALVVAALDVVKAVVLAELVLAVLLALVFALVLATEGLAAAEPDPVMAELVAVATELLCATLLGNPVYSAGPGMV